MASRMLSDSEQELERHLKDEPGYAPALSPELEELLDWVEASFRSVQEVAEQMRLLPDEERDVVVDHLRISTLYGREYVRDLEGNDTRFRNRQGRSRIEADGHRRDIPEGFQKVLVNIERLKSLGRNVMALTPEMLPEDVLRLWPPGWPLPELVVVNLDHEVPRVSVVRRLPSAGGVKIDRSALTSMTGIVAKVLGDPATLRKVAAREGLGVEHAFKKVDVSLSEIAWSPQLELGEILYDWEEVKVEDEVEEEAAAEQARKSEGMLEAASARISHNADLVSDLELRMRALDEGWQAQGGEGARDAEGRMGRLTERRELASRHLMDLDLARLDLVQALGEEEVPDLEKRLQDFETDMEKMEKETAELARQVSEEERQLEVYRRVVEEKRVARTPEPPVEEEPREGRRRQKAMVEPGERDEEQGGRPQGA